MWCTYGSSLPSMNWAEGTYPKTSHEPLHEWDQKSWSTVWQICQVYLITLVTIYNLQDI